LDQTNVVLIHDALKIGVVFIAVHVLILYFFFAEVGVQQTEHQKFKLVDFLIVFFLGFDDGFPEVLVFGEVLIERGVDLIDLGLAVGDAVFEDSELDTLGVELVFYVLHDEFVLVQMFLLLFDLRKTAPCAVSELGVVEHVAAADFLEAVVVQLPHKGDHVVVLEELHEHLFFQTALVSDLKLVPAFVPAYDFLEGRVLQDLVQFVYERDDVLRVRFCFLAFR